MCSFKSQWVLIKLQVSPQKNIWLFCQITEVTDCYSVAKSHPTRCDPMDCSTPGFPVLHYLLEFAQTHVHWVSDAIQPSYPLSPPSPPALDLSQHQGLFQWVSSSHQVTSISAKYYLWGKEQADLIHNLSLPSLFLTDEFCLHYWKIEQIDSICHPLAS